MIAGKEAPKEFYRQRISSILSAIPTIVKLNNLVNLKYVDFLEFCINENDINYLLSFSRTEVCGISKRKWFVPRLQSFSPRASLFPSRRSGDGFSFWFMVEPLLGVIEIKKRNGSALVVCSTESWTFQKRGRGRTEKPFVGLSAPN